MGIEPTSQENVGSKAFSRGRWGIKNIPRQLKSNAVDAVNKTKKLGKDDPRRVTHSIKVGLALSMVSLLYYFRPLYGGLGVTTMWAVLTVVVVFEFSVGATLSKGLNRGIATFVAGALGIGAHHLATLAGDKGEPILLVSFVFLLSAASSFSRFFPGIKRRYDYGVLIFILTFSLVSVSGYRVDKIIELAHHRLSTIIIGSATCIIISIFVCPVWAGEDLHKLVALNIEKLSEFLEGFGGEYFEKDGESDVDSKVRKPSLSAYRSVLNSKATEESLANFARWEPPHGHFGFHHPWKQYLKIGVLTRQCACRIEALNSCITTQVQVPQQEFKKKIEAACINMTLESSKALMELSSAIRTMTYPHAVAAYLSSSRNAADSLKSTLKTAALENTNLLQIIPAATVTTLLVEILSCIEDISESVHELADLAKFKTSNPPTTKEKPQVLPQETTKPISDIDGPHVLITILESFRSTSEISRSQEPI